MESQICNHEYNNRIAEYKIKIKIKYNNDNDNDNEYDLLNINFIQLVNYLNDEQVKIALTQSGARII